MRIIDYRPEHLPAVRACVVALQEFERAVEPRLPPGDAIVDAYMERLFGRCRQFSGRLFLAEFDRRVVGFVSVLGAFRVDEPCEDHAPLAYVDDLIVLAEHRHLGIGRSLLAAAETYARECGRDLIRLCVKGANHSARAFYAQTGFGDYELQLEKRL